MGRIQPRKRKGEGMPAHIEKRPRADGGASYRVRWRDRSGRRHSMRVDGTGREALRAAKALKRQIEAAHNLGQEFDPERRAPTPPRLLDLIPAYLRARGRTLAGSTLKVRYKHLSLWYDFMRARSADPGAEHMTRESLEGFDADMMARGLAPTTRLNRMGHVRDLWRWCSEGEHAQWFAPPPRIVMPPPVPRISGRAPDWSEVDQLIKTAEAEASGPPRLQGRAQWPPVLLTLMRYTGLRCGQVQRLRWEDFDLRRQTVHIRPELGKSSNEKRGRTVPITPHLVAYLAGRGVREGYVVPHEGARRPSGAWQRAIQSPIKRLWRLSGADPGVWQGRPLHCLRAAFTSGLCAVGPVGGVDDRAVETLLGRSGGTGWDRYVDKAQVWARLLAAVRAVPKVGASHVVRLRDAGGDA